MFRDIKDTVIKEQFNQRSIKLYNRCWNYMKSVKRGITLYFSHFENYKNYKKSYSPCQPVSVATTTYNLSSLICYLIKLIIKIC